MRKAFPLFFILLIFILGLSKISSVHAEAPFNIEKIITSGKHKDLAKYYRAQAEDQKALAETYNKMKIRYQNNPVHYPSAYAPLMVRYCEDLRAQALKRVELYNNLAIQEEKLGAIDKSHS
jgi:ribosomal protein L13